MSASNVTPAVLAPGKAKQAPIVLPGKDPAARSAPGAAAKSLIYGDPILAASYDDRHFGWILSAAMSVLLLIALCVWARFAVIEQVARGDARTISSKREQVIQSLEGGILTEMMVREGDVVKAGDPLVRLDPVRAQSSLGEGRRKILALQAAADRLMAESTGQTTPAFHKSLAKEADLLATERATFTARTTALRDAVLALQGARELLMREAAITEPMVARGLAAEVDLLRLKRQLSEVDGQLAERVNRFRAEAGTELSRVKAEIAQQTELLAAKQDQMDRTLIRAPIRGTIKNIRVTTRGGVIQSGQDILEIIPLDDHLLVEAKIRPSDIAFIQQGQSADVKISAYDAQLYGSLKGKVEFISPDTLREERKAVEETYYRVLVRTDNSTLRYGNVELPVMSGMTATVDIKTGTTTVANSLLKPVLRLKEAFRER